GSPGLCAATCNNPKYPLEDSAGTACVSACNAGEWNNNGACTGCSAPSCSPSAFFVPCAATADAHCQACDSTCLRCTSSATNCIICSPGNVWQTSAGPPAICLPTCQDPTFPYKNSANTRCVAACASNEFYNTATAICTVCPQGCTTCSLLTSCSL